MMPGSADLDQRLRSAAGEPDTDRALGDVMGRIRRRSQRKVIALVVVVAVGGLAAAAWAGQRHQPVPYSVSAGKPSRTTADIVTSVPEPSIASTASSIPAARAGCGPLTGALPRVEEYAVSQLPPGFAPDGSVHRTSTGDVDAGGETTATLRFVDPEGRSIEVTSFGGHSPAGFVRQAHRGAAAGVVNLSRCSVGPDGPATQQVGATLSSTPSRSVVGAQESEFGGFLVVAGPGVTTDELILVASGLRTR
jgi:hypothetical protein